MRKKLPKQLLIIVYCLLFALQVDFPTAIGVVLERDNGSTLMEIDGDKGKQGGPTYYIDTNALRVPRENMEAISPLKNGMSMVLCLFLPDFKIALQAAGSHSCVDRCYVQQQAVRTDSWFTGCMEMWLVFSVSGLSA